MRRPATTIPVLLLTLASAPTLAQDEAFADPLADEPDISVTEENPASPWLLCPPLIELPPEKQAILDQPENPDAPLEATADEVELNKDGVSALSGDVELVQGNRYMNAESLTFDRESGIARSEQPVRFANPQILLDAKAVKYDMDSGEGDFAQSDFYLLGRHGRGAAAAVHLLGDNQARMETVSYTTCPAGDEDWWLRASSFDLDQNEGEGIGRNVRVAFMGVPFFYVPWISFPIDDRRKTGFLFPEFGDSGINGAYLQIPYYFNIAPNLDATLAPLYMSKRGTRLDGEFRYLFGWGKGEIAAQYLEEDRITSERRYSGNWKHNSGLPLGWNMAVNYNKVSDAEYLQDFSETGQATVQSFMPQMVMAGKSGLEYGINIMAMRFQTVDPTIPEASRPYEMKPKLAFFYKPMPFAGVMELDLNGELTNFQREQRIGGWRRYFAPSLSARIGGPGLNLTPKLTYWRNDYSLETPDGSDVEYRVQAPISTLDLKAVFERRTGGGLIQTLEPRLYYLNVPYREQADIPLFDTSPPSATLSQLYRENRFYGPDRLGDTEQLTSGIAMRWIDPADYRTLFSIEFARARYFEDRRVQLSASAEPDAADVSDIFAAIEYAPWETSRLNLDLSWDPDEKQVGVGTLRYQYHPGNKTVLNLSYTFRRDRKAAPDLDEPLEQAGMSFAAPLGPRWRLFGKAIYSIPEERSLETTAGFEYESCCWAFRAFNRRYIFNREGDFNSSLWLQLELKGLSSVGRKVDDFLANDIRGYGDSP